MGSRTAAHQLSNGLYVSGLPETQPKERLTTMGSRAVPYTGGDVKKSGELGKMFDIVVDPGGGGGVGGNSVVPNLTKGSRPSSSSLHNSGSVRSGSRPNSGQLPKLSTSGSMNKKSSGPLPLQPTGLITSGPLNSSGERTPSLLSRRSGQLDGSGSVVTPKKAYGSAVTTLAGEGVKFGLRVSKVAIWIFVVVAVMGLLIGAFLMVAVKKAVILVVVGTLIMPVVLAVMWNYAWGKRGIRRFVESYPNTELRGAVDGQYVKITGVVTCGSIPLESSFQREPRCVYVSTGLYEQKGCFGKLARPRNCCFSWGCRHSESYAADFYISDFQTGLRALVKTGYGAKVAPFVEPSVLLDVTKENRDLSPNFLQWLADRKLSSDNEILRLKEGYVKEGSTASVMGVVRRHENVLMIVAPPEPISTGCQWLRCLLPMNVEGLILSSENSQDADVIPV